MNRRFLRNFMDIGLGSLVSMILGFLTTPIITRIVSPTDYGMFSIFTMYSNLAIMVLYLGLDQSLVRFFYDEEGMHYKQALLRKCISLPIISTLIVSSIVILLAKLHTISFEFNNSILIWLCFYTLVLVINRFSMLIIRLQFKTKLYSVLGIIQKVFYILFIFLMLFATSLGYMKVLVYATVGSTVVCTLFSIISEKDIWRFKKSPIRVATVSLRQLLQYGYPYILSMGITSVFQAVDKISLNIYGTYKDVGVFTSAMTLINIFNIIQTAFNTVWAPASIEHYSKDPDDTSFYKQGNEAITVIMFFVGISLIFFKDIFAVILGPQYREASYILPFLIFIPIMYTVSESTVNGLVFMKKSKLQVVVALGACVTNLLLNSLLVPVLGTRGAAISTGLSYIVFFTLRTLLSTKFYYVDYGLKKFYSYTMLVCAYAFYNTFVPFNFLSVVFYVVCLLVLLFVYKDSVLKGKKLIISFIKSK